MLPTLFDSYGRFAPRIHRGLADWVKVQQKHGYQISIDDGVAFGLKFGKSSIVYTIECGAESKDLFTKWVKQHIADGAWTSDGVLFHGMVPLHPDPTGPFMYFVRDDDFVSSLATV